MLTATAWLMLAMPILCRYYSPTWQAYYGYAAEQLQGTLAWLDPERLQRPRATSLAGKALGLLSHVYGFFTAPLRDFYGTFMTACSIPGILLVVCRKGRCRGSAFQQAIPVT